MAAKLAPQMVAASRVPRTARVCRRPWRVQRSAQGGGDAQFQFGLVGVVQGQQDLLGVEPGLGVGGQDHSISWRAAAALSALDGQQRVGGPGGEDAERLAVHLLEDDPRAQFLTDGLGPGHPERIGHHAGPHLPLDGDGDGGDLGVGGVHQIASAPTMRPAGTLRRPG